MRHISPGGCSAERRCRNRLCACAAATRPALTAGSLVVNTAVYLLAGVVSALLAPCHLARVLARLSIGACACAHQLLFAYFGLVDPTIEELFCR